MTVEEVSKMIVKLPMFQNSPKTKMCKVIMDSDSEMEQQCKNINSDLYDSEYTAESIYQIDRASKKPKTGHLTTEVIVEIINQHGKVVPIRCLSDTGTSATIILSKYVDKGKAKAYKNLPTRWSTMGGVFITKRKALLEIKLPEFSTNKTVQWVCYVLCACR